jgi:hypothetical protein
MKGSKTATRRLAFGLAWMWGLGRVGRCVERSSAGVDGCCVTGTDDKAKRLCKWQQLVSLGMQDESIYVCTHDQIIMVFRASCWHAHSACAAC